jgi:hypothetical protein
MSPLDPDLDVERGTAARLHYSDPGSASISGVVSEWLRREIRNLLGSPAQVRILSTSVFSFAVNPSSMYSYFVWQPNVSRFHVFLLVCASDGRRDTLLRRA